MLERLTRSWAAASREWRGWTVPEELIPPWATASSGVPVDRMSAVGLSGVWACVRLLTGAVSRMPIDILIDQDGVPRPYQVPRWLRQPIMRDPNSNRVTHIAQVMVSLLLDGNAFVLTPRDSSNDVSELFVIDPQRVKIGRNSDQSPIYEVRSERGAVVEYSANEMLHLPLQPFPGMDRGMSPIEACRQVFGSGLAAQEYANRFFNNSARPDGGYIGVPQGSQVTVDQLKRDWDAAHKGPMNAGSTGVLTGGAEWKPLGFTNEQSQFIESRQFSLGEAARIYGVPPYMIGDVEKTTSWGTGIEQQSIGFVTYSLNDYLVLIEEGYKRLVPNPASYMRFNRNALLRGDAKSRGDLYQALWGISVMSADEIREREDLPPLPNGLGKKYWAPLNFKPVDEELEPPPPPTNGQVGKDDAEALVGQEGTT